jgi:hypothetical protein
MAQCSALDYKKDWVGLNWKYRPFWFSTLTEHSLKVTNVRSSLASDRSCYQDRSWSPPPTIVKCFSVCQIVHPTPLACISDRTTNDRGRMPNIHLTLILHECSWYTWQTFAKSQISWFLSTSISSPINIPTLALFTSFPPISSVNP